MITSSEHYRPNFFTVILIIFSIGISSRFINIGTQGILIDETWVVPNTFLHFGTESIFPKLFTYPHFQSLSEMKQDLVRKVYELHPIFQVAAYQASDVHPPLFFILNYFWGRAFGYDVGTIRTPATLYFLTIMVLLPWILRRQGFRDEMVLYAVGFLVLSPFLLFFSNFARPYTLLILLTMTSSFLCYEFVKNGFKKSSIVLYILLATCSLYTHYYASLVIASQAAYLFLELVVIKRQLKMLMKTALVFIVILCLYIPWGAIMVMQITLRYPLLEQAFEYINYKTIMDLLLSFSMFQSYSTTYHPINIIAMVIQVSLFITGAYHLFKRINEMEARFWLVFLSLPLCLIVISNMIKPVFTVRNCLIIFIPYLVICAAGLSSLRRMTVKIGLMGILVPIGLYSVFHGLSYGNVKGPNALEDWKSTAAFLGKMENLPPVYVYHPSYREALYYYIPDKETIRGLFDPMQKEGPIESRFLMVVVKPEQWPLEDKIEREIPFLKKTDRYHVQFLESFPHIYVFMVETRGSPS